MVANSLIIDVNSLMAFVVVRYFRHAINFAVVENYVLIPIRHIIAEIVHFTTIVIFDVDFIVVVVPDFVMGIYF